MKIIMMFGRIQPSRRIKDDLPTIRSTLSIALHFLNPDHKVPTTVAESFFQSTKSHEQNLDQHHRDACAKCGLKAANDGTWKLCQKDHIRTAIKIVGPPPNLVVSKG